MEKMILLRPILSEKSNLLKETQNKYVFEVEKNANKLEIKSAVEKKFNVKIKRVATINFKGKSKNMTIKSNGHVLRTNGNRSSWKKAIVSLKEGFTLDLLGSDI